MRHALFVVAFSLGSFAVADDYITIKGQVKWNGTEPPKLVPVRVGPGVLPPGAPPLFPTDVLVDPKSLGLRNVVVWLRPDTENRKDAFPPEKIKNELRELKSIHRVIDTPALHFEPRVVAARAGDTLQFINTSKNIHNINYESDSETSGGLLPPAPGGFRLKKPLVVQTTPISFSCNICPWMSGRLRVFDHPYFALTDKDGRFEIKDAPVGKWRIVYWHESGFHKGKAGILGDLIDVKEDMPKTGTMALKPLAFEIIVPKP